MKKELLIIVLFILTACPTTGNIVTSSASAPVLKEYGPAPEVHFCPGENCRSIFSSYLLNATDIKCALYDVDIPEVITILNNKKAELVLDDQSSNRSEMHAVIDSKYSQMHNKFCILDNEIVITGSMNPTLRDTELNDNNLLIIRSKNIAQTYTDEFEELHAGTFSGGAKSLHNEFYLNDEHIEVYFCPEDWCANKALYTLDTAQESIYFMTFSFTHNEIGDLLVKKKQENVIVKGIMEKTQSSQYSQFKKLADAGIMVKWDNNKGNMHHKVFVVDHRYVITGSMNPTLNGDTNNDENLLIIDSPALAEKYLTEFSLIFPRN